MAKRPQLTGRAAILAVVVCAIAMSLAYPVREYISNRRDLSALHDEKAKVDAEARRIAEQSQAIKDPNNIKRRAKQELHYCGAGEKCYVVMDTPREQGQSAVKQQAAAQPPWYQTLWESVEAADSGKGMKAGTTGGK